ncbi:MAG: VIT1/CCC1 transporter family protein [Patescibacteria group bacterium]
MRLKEVIPEVVYGGVDGTISTFAVVAGSFGGGLTLKATFILGVASLVADGFSMAVGSYLSAQSDNDRHPLRNGIVTFISFVILGSLMLWPYLGGIMFEWAEAPVFVGSAVLAGVSFMIVGGLKSRVQKSSLLRGAAEVVILGFIAAGIAYLLGDVLEAAIT